MVLVTKKQNPVVDFCCSHAIHPGRQLTSHSPVIVLEAVDFSRVTQYRPFLCVFVKVKSSGDNEVLKRIKIMIAKRLGLGIGMEMERYPQSQEMIGGLLQ